MTNCLLLLDNDLGYRLDIYTVQRRFSLTGAFWRTDALTFAFLFADSPRC